MSLIPTVAPKIVSGQLLWRICSYLGIFSSCGKCMMKAEQV